MKKRFLIMVLVVLPVLASAQNYVVDNIFGKDSVAFTTGVKKERASAGFGAGRKKGGTAEVAIDTIYVRNGEAVRLKEVKKDSLRLFGLLLEEVPVLYGKKTCYTLASNLKLSADNPEGTVDPLVARLKNHRNLDIHGRDRWLFSRWLVLALLILGLVGVLASLFVGKTGRILLMSAVLLLDAYIFRVGLDTALWFLEPALTREWFCIVGAVLYVLFFGLLVRLLVSLFKKKESGSTVFAILLILAGLPVWGLSFLIVFGASMKLLFTYWWVGVLTLALICLASVPRMTEYERRNWVKIQAAEREKNRRKQEEWNRREEKKKERLRFEKSQNKLEF